MTRVEASHRPVVSPSIHWAGRLAGLMTLALCPAAATAAIVARLVTADGAIESVAIVSLSPETCRFGVAEPGSVLPPVAETAVPPAGDPEREGLPQPRSQPLRMIDLPTRGLREWGRAVPSPVGPQALLAGEDDAGRRETRRFLVAGRLEAFDGHSLVVAGGDLGAVRLPADLVDRWVSTASVASRAIAASGTIRDRPRLLLSNGDIVEPESLRVDDAVAFLRVATVQPNPPATDDGRSAAGIPSTGGPIACPLERVLAVEPAAAIRPTTGHPRWGSRIVVVLADGSRLPVRGLTVSPPPVATGIPTRRTATLLPAWSRDDGGTTLRAEPLACDADAIAAIEFQPADTIAEDGIPPP